MDFESIVRLLDELFRLVSVRDGFHHLNQHISLPQCGIIIPPIQMTRFPRLQLVFGYIVKKIVYIMLFAFSLKNFFLENIEIEKNMKKFLVFCLPLLLFLPFSF